jgi:cytochrome c oxidase subunit 4
MTTDQPKLTTYATVYVLLLVGLAATVGASFVNAGRFNIALAMAIALAKAALVVLYFMHVRYSSRLIWLATFAGAVWLAIMLAFVLADYATRGWISTGTARSSGESLRRSPARRADDVDQAVMESFPARDPRSSTGPAATPSEPRPAPDSRKRGATTRRA